MDEKNGEPMAMTTMVDGNVPQIDKRKTVTFSGAVIRLACDLMHAKLLSNLHRVTESFIEAPEVQRVLSLTTPSTRELEAIEDALKRAVIEERTMITSRLNKAHGILQVCNEQHDDATMAASIMRQAASATDPSFYNTIPLTMKTNREIRAAGQKAIREQKRKLAEITKKREQGRRAIRKGSK